MTEFDGMTINASAPIRMNYGGQAFPNEGFNGWGEPEKGMSLRDYFAAKAMQVLRNDLSAEWIAERAYEMADAMLKAREA